MGNYRCIAGAYARDILVYNDIITYNEPVFLPNLMLNRKAGGFILEPENRFFNVYPNPAGDYIYVNYKLPEESKNIRIKIISINGRVERSIDLKYSVDIKMIRLAELSNGMYFILLEANGKTVDSANISIIK